MPDTPKRIEAPFTMQQLEALNDYQQSGRFHPFTCRNRNDGEHFVRFGDHGVLVATPTGWVCPDCPYTQDWAWDFMAAGEGSRDY